MESTRTGALQYRDVIGQVQSGRAGFGLGDSWKSWGEATLAERRQMVTSFVCKQEEETRQSAGVEREMDELA